MAFLYLAESAESTWPYRLGLKPSLTVKMTDTLNLSCFHSWRKAPCPTPPSGMMCGLFLKSPSSSCPWTSFLEAFHARTSVLRELEQAWKEADQGYFSTSSAYVANFDRDSFSWKTSQLSLFGGLTAFSWSSPRWGSIVDGRLYQPLRWVPRILESDGFYWPTPSADSSGEPDLDQMERDPSCPTAPLLMKGTKWRKQQTLNIAVKLWPTPRVSGQESPDSHKRRMDKRRMEGKPTGGYSSLSGAVRWPTPTTQDAENNGGNFQMKRNSLPLNAAVKRWPTPRAEDSQCAGGHRDRDDTLYGAICKPKDGSSQAPGSLNPSWVEWLMGYPTEWTALDAWVIQSFLFKRGRRSRGSSGSPVGKK